MTRRTGTGLMEATGLGTITGDQASQDNMMVNFILVSTFLGLDSGMTSIISSIHRDQYASMPRLKVGNSQEKYLLIHVKNKTLAQKLMKSFYRSSQQPFELNFLSLAVCVNFYCEAVGGVECEEDFCCCDLASPSLGQGEESELVNCQCVWH